MERRELFSSLFPSKNKGKEDVIRPPYYDNQEAFHKECITCEETPCVIACQENIIVIDQMHTPIIDFQKGGCTYCDECANSCPLDVLSLENKAVIKATVEIEMLKCLSWSDTMCFSCKDPCLDDAIEFLGMFRPTINKEKCTSCGFCIGVCPTNAISVKGI